MSLPLYTQRIGGLESSSSYFIRSSLHHCSLLHFLLPRHQLLSSWPFSLLIVSLYDAQRTNPSKKFNRTKDILSRNIHKHLSPKCLLGYMAKRVPSLSPNPSEGTKLVRFLYCCENNSPHPISWICRHTPKCQPAQQHHRREWVKARAIFQRLWGYCGWSGQMWVYQRGTHICGTDIFVDRKGADADTSFSLLRWNSVEKLCGSFASFRYPINIYIKRFYRLKLGDSSRVDLAPTLASFSIKRSRVDPLMKLYFQYCSVTHTLHDLLLLSLDEIIIFFGSRCKWMRTCTSTFWNSTSFKFWPPFE